MITEYDLTSLLWVAQLWPDSGGDVDYFMPVTGTDGLCDRQHRYLWHVAQAAAPLWQPMRWRKWYFRSFRVTRTYDIKVAGLGMTLKLYRSRKFSESAAVVAGVAATVV